MKLSAVCVTRQTDAGLAAVKFTGGVGMAQFAVLMAEHDEWMQSHDAPAVIADYRGARLLTNATTLWAAVAAAAPDRAGLVTPSALVAAAGHFDVLDEYARLMRQSGVARQAFTCYDEARAWAAQQAQIHAAQRAHRLIARLRRSR